MRQQRRGGRGDAEGVTAWIPRTLGCWTRTRGVGRTASLNPRGSPSDSTNAQGGHTAPVNPRGAPSDSWRRCRGGWRSHYWNFSPRRPLSARPRPRASRRPGRAPPRPSPPAGPPPPHIPDSGWPRQISSVGGARRRLPEGSRVVQGLRQRALEAAAAPCLLVAAVHPTLPPAPLPIAAFFLIFSRTDGSTPTVAGCASPPPTPGASSSSKDRFA
mmetsp:Transcript_14105/g.21592  ORF Transcript_14105/g.21592 Transcript_14105/m.21592 type:complete len:215 (-) Transcript_14105:202-846(-)